MSTIEFESKICLSGKNGKYFVIPAYFVKLLKLQPDSRFKFNLRKSDSKTWVSSTMFEGVPQFKPSSSCTLHLLTSNYGQKFDTIKIGDKVVVKISYDSSRNLCITHKAL